MALMKGKPKPSVAFEWKDGDRVIFCFESSEIRDGEYGAYASTILRVVAGPLNDRSRNGGPWRGEDRIHSQVFFDNTNFSNTDKAQQAFDSLMYALGHDDIVAVDGDDRKEETRAWLKLTVDREFVGVLRRRKRRSGEFFMAIDQYERPTRQDWAAVVEAYTQFGTARGLGWTKDPDPDGPLWPWDPSKYQGMAAAAASSAAGAPVSRRAALRAPVVERPAQDAPPSTPEQPAASGPEPEQAPAAVPAASPEPMVVSEQALKTRLEGMTIVQLTAFLDAQPLLETDWSAVMAAEAAGKKRPKALARINAKIAEAAKRRQEQQPPAEQPPAEQEPSSAAEAVPGGNPNLATETDIPV